MLRWYDDLVRQHPHIISAIEEGARGITIFLPGRFSYTDLRGEAVYTTINLVSLYHDHVLDRERGVMSGIRCENETETTSKIKSILQVLRTIQVLAEMCALRWSPDDASVAQLLNSMQQQPPSPQQQQQQSSTPQSTSPLSLSSLLHPFDLLSRVLQSAHQKAAQTSGYQLLSDKLQQSTQWSIWSQVSTRWTIVFIIELIKCLCLFALFLHNNGHMLVSQTPSDMIEQARQRKVKRIREKLRQGIPISQLHRDSSINPEAGGKSNQLFFASLALMFMNPTMASQLLQVGRNRKKEKNNNNNNNTRNRTSGLPTSETVEILNSGDSNTSLDEEEQKRQEAIDEEAKRLEKKYRDLYELYIINGRLQNPNGVWSGPNYVRLSSKTTATSSSSSLSSPPTSATTTLSLSSASHQHHQQQLLLQQAPSKEQIVGELLYIFRPLIYVCMHLTQAKAAQMSWKPFLISLSIDVISRLLLSTAIQKQKNNSHGDNDNVSNDSSSSSHNDANIHQHSRNELHQAQRKELARRLSAWAYYMIRSPLFQRLTLPLLSKILYPFTLLPLVGMIPRMILDVVSLIPAHYFHTSAT